MQKRVVNWAVMIVVSILLVACSSSVPAMPTGVWEGGITSSNGTSMPVLIEFDQTCSKGNVCAQVAYATLNCETNLTYLKQKKKN